MQILILTKFCCIFFQQNYIQFKITFLNRNQMFFGNEKWHIVVLLRKNKGKMFFVKMLFCAKNGI